MIVVSVPEREGELREGTLLKTKMLDTLSTSRRCRGAVYGGGDGADRAEWAGDYSGGLGAGWAGDGGAWRKTDQGAAPLHLETRNVTLPDGTHYIVHAQLIDTGQSEFKVTDEGTMKRKGPSEGDAGGDRAG